MDSFYGEYVSTISGLPNPNLRWEQTGTTNLGTDIIMFNGRLSIGADIWWKHTSDAIIDTKVSTVNGVTSYLMNRGALDNHGGSFSISGTPLQRYGTCQRSVGGHILFVQVPRRFASQRRAYVRRL